MKANELMVGNIVRYDGMTVYINQVNKTRIEGMIDKNDLMIDIGFRMELLEPIPITEELLLKNGFNRIDEGYFDIYIGDCKLYLINLLGIRENLKTDLWRIDLSGKFLSSFLNKGVLETNALHQLQNLLNIMGVEMEWKV